MVPLTWVCTGSVGRSSAAVLALTCTALAPVAHAQIARDSASSKVADTAAAASPTTASAATASDIRNAPPSSIALGANERLERSPSGEHWLAYDAHTLQARVFDATGRVQRNFTTDVAYAHTLVSDTGWIALAMPITLPESRTLVLELRDAAGALVWREASSYAPQALALAFAPHASELALAAQRRSADGPNDGALELLVVRSDGVASRRALDSQTPVDVVYAPSGARVAFAARVDVLAAQPTSTSGDAPRAWLHVLDRDKEGWVDAPLLELAQPLDEGCVAWSADASRVLVGGLACIAGYDAASGARLWRTELAPRGEPALDTCAAIGALGGRIAVAHRVAAPLDELRYAVHWLDLDGKQLGEPWISEPEPRRAHARELLEPVAERRVLVVHTAPRAHEIAVP